MCIISNLGFIVKSGTYLSCFLLAFSIDLPTPNSTIAGIIDEITANPTNHCNQDAPSNNTNQIQNKHAYTTIAMSQMKKVNTFCPTGENDAYAHKPRRGTRIRKYILTFRANHFNTPEHAPYSRLGSAVQRLCSDEQPAVLEETECLRLLIVHPEQSLGDSFVCAFHFGTHL